MRSTAGKSNKANLRQGRAQAQQEAGKASAKKAASRKAVGKENGKENGNAGSRDNSKAVTGKAASKGAGKPARKAARKRGKFLHGEQVIDEFHIIERDEFVGGMVYYEFEKKSAQINIRMPHSLVKAVKAQAAKRGMPYQRFIREAIERALK